MGVVERRGGRERKRQTQTEGMSRGREKWCKREKETHRHRG